jgi:hypothetical protein
MRTPAERGDTLEREATRIPESVRTVAHTTRMIHDPSGGSAAVAAGFVARAGAGPAQLRAAEVVQLQRVVGNAAVGALLGVARREAAPAGEVIQAVMDDEEEEMPAQLASATVQRETDVAAPSAPLPNLTGLPDGLKSGVESLSGMPMDDVRVHYDSDAPARVAALAYAQGTDIHVATGQEQHLPHEAWHVVQQKQGRVRPTLDVGGVAINDDAGLEHEADVMGARSLVAAATSPAGPMPVQRFNAAVTQR